MFSVEFQIVLYPPTHLLAPVGDDTSCLGPQVRSLICCFPHTFSWRFQYLRLSGYCLIVGTSNHLQFQCLQVLLIVVTLVVNERIIPYGADDWFHYSDVFSKQSVFWVPFFPYLRTATL